MGLIVTLIAQLIETSFKVRLVLAQLEGRQNPTIVGTVATVVEQRNIPMGAKGVQELQQRPGDSGNSKLNSRSCSALDGRPPTI